MNGKLIAEVIVIVGIVALTIVSQRSNPASQLRPQAVQQAKETMGPNNDQTSIPTTSNPNTELPQPNQGHQPQVAGTSREQPISPAPPSTQQVIKKEISDDGDVKVNIQQKTTGSAPVNNQVKVKIDTKQNPPLVEVSTNPQPVDCAQDIYNCDDFATCTAAQDAFKACPTDINNLDPDNDGTPCNNLCD